MIIETLGILLCRDPIALAVHVYHMTKWPELERYGIAWEEKIPLIANNFNITTLRVKRALDYLDQCGIG